MVKQPAGKAGLLLGDVAPDFTLPTADGRFLSLQDFRGGKVLLVFLRHYA
ncbi:MAG TPA: redoxin domain-containing protein [Dehalococcoidia bacterium]|nr:redoxin domain-containing protein [Dehalococcoidia bacterium]